MSKRFVVPKDPAVIHGWARDFAAQYGLPPIAGGETPGAAPAATPPAPQPQAAAPPAQTPPPSQPAAPAQPGGEQPQQGAEGAQVPDAAPDWAKPLLERIDAFAPQAPAVVDPLAVELGLAPAPPQPLPGQPGFDPSQAGQAAGQPQPGMLPPQLGGPPAVQPQLPGQPQAPGQPQGDPTEELVNRLIDERARGVVDSVMQQSVVPYLQAQEIAQERREIVELREDWPELKDPNRASEVVAQARAWAAETLGNPAYAAKPGYLETVFLAMKQLESAKGGQPAAPANGSGETPIEGGGGVNPAPAQTDSAQLAEQIVSAGGGGGLDPMWTGGA